jgi:hypothetical protein
MRYEPNELVTEAAEKIKEGCMVVKERVEGEVQYNDGNFVEVQTVGTEGIERDCCWTSFSSIAPTTQKPRKSFGVGSRSGCGSK